LPATTESLALTAEMMKRKDLDAKITKYQNNEITWEQTFMPEKYLL
jgi:hypothetical protein